MNTRRILCLLLLAGLSVAHGQASQIDDQWSIDAEVRFRYEMMDGFNDKEYGVSEDHYLLSRIRLGITYIFNPDILMRVSVQDARAFGWEFEHSDWYSKEFGMIDNPQEDYLELYHTYLQMSNLKGMPLTLTVGRQRIAYGDKRVFGPGEWKNSGKWIWDAAKLSYRSGENFLDIFGGKTILHDQDEFSLKHHWKYDGAGLYGHYAWNKGAIEPILGYKHNGNGKEKYQNLTHYYAGFRIYDNNLNSFYYNGTLIKEWGKQTSLSGKNLNVDAIGWHLDGGYTFEIDYGKIKVGAGYTYASGNNADTSENERFDSAFGASDLYYGRMNLISWSNIKDAEMFATFSPLSNLKVTAEFHSFYLANTGDTWRKYKNIDGTNEGHIGNEVDIVTKYTLSKDVEFQAGYGYFRPGDFIEKNILSDDASDWFFLQTTLKF